MLVETKCLHGPALNWAVGIARDPRSAKLLYRLMKNGNWDPAGNDRDSAPIIDSEYIATHRPNDKGWAAHDYKYTTWATGPTRKVAAMRCYVMYKLGDRVNIPEEFL